MEVNRNKLLELFEKDFKGSYAEAGRQLKVAPAQIFRIINQQAKAGAVFLGKLYTYCDTHNLDFKDYVIVSSKNCRKE